MKISSKRAALQRGVIDGMAAPFYVFSNLEDKIKRRKPASIALSWVEVGESISNALDRERFQLDQEDYKRGHRIPAE